MRLICILCMLVWKNSILTGQYDRVDMITTYIYKVVLKKQPCIISCVARSLLRRFKIKTVLF